MTFGVLVCPRDAGSEALRIMSQLPQYCNVRTKRHLGHRWQCMHRQLHTPPVPVSEFTENLTSLMKNRPSRLGSPSALIVTEEQVLQSPEGWTASLCAHCSNAIVKSKDGPGKFSHIPLTTTFAQKVQRKQ